MSRAECEHRVAAPECEGVGKRGPQAAAQRRTGNVAYTGAFAVQIVEVRGRGRLLRRERQYGDDGFDHARCAQHVRMHRFRGADSDGRGTRSEYTADGRDCDRVAFARRRAMRVDVIDRKSTRLNSSHRTISYAVFCLKKKNKRLQ